MEGEQELISRVRQLSQSKVSTLVQEALTAFSSFSEKPCGDWFSELCFCVLTANFQSQKSIDIQQQIGPGFSNLSTSRLSQALRHLGYRFPNTRAQYICANRCHQKNIKKTIQSIDDHQMRRQWLVEHIRGLGMKEASHFLRNVGYFNYAIIDFHILDILQAYGIAERTPTLTPSRYMAIEGRLAQLARACGMSQGEMDLYLWYLETGKVLK